MSGMFYVLKLLLACILYTPCYAQVSGVACSTNVDCTSYVNSVCDTGAYKCSCLSNYYDSGTTCSPKLNLGVTCTNTVQCLDANAECTGSKCSCKSTFYDSDLNNGNTAGTCVQKLESGEPCMKEGTTECKPDSSCKSDGQSGLRCTCNDRFYDSNFDAAKGLCLAEINLDNPCTNEGSTTECVPNAECKNLKCACTSDYFDNNGSSADGTCEIKISVDAGCSSTGPGNQCKDSLSTCKDVAGTHKCACNSGYYNSYGQCFDQTAVGIDCIIEGSAKQCSDPNSSCKQVDGGYKCLCDDDHYDYSGTCTPKIDLEDVCFIGRPDGQCSDINAICRDDSGTFKCLCKEGYFKKTNGVCSIQIENTETCLKLKAEDQCSDDNAACSQDNGGQYKCLCSNDYYLNSATVCKPKVMLEVVCTSGQPDNQCEDTNAACQMETSSTYKCLCKDDYYKHLNGICAGKSALEETCINGQPTNQCSVQETECIPATSGGSDYKCLCKAGYYSDSPSCKPLVDLQVTNLGVPDDKTGETYFLVTWTNPSTVGSINRYELILIFNGNSDVTSNIPTSETQRNVTARIPGRKYSISLVSVETHSRPSQQTTSVTITDGCRPSVPGDIIQNVFTAPTISISWTITGDIEYLSGKVNDTSVNPELFNITAVLRMSPTVSFYNLKYGKRYTFTVRSHSNGFESDPRIQTIRTTPTTPQTPRDFACTDLNIFDRSLTLTWREPLLPNGEIQHYIVYESNRNLQFLTNGSVLEQIIEGLQPEQYYYFSIVTVNDASSGMSARTGIIPCRTKTALATKPLNAEVTGVTKDTISVRWDPPMDPGGQILAYRLTVKNVTDSSDEKCVQEIILQCGECVTQRHTESCEINILFFDDLNTKTNQTMNLIIFNVSPYVMFAVRIQAVSAKGDGYPTYLQTRTSQDIPQRSLDVTGSVVNSSVITVTWTQPLPRPGVTTYYIKTYEVILNSYPVFVKFLNITGFNTQTVQISELEAYWNYTFSVVAATNKGNSEQSEMSAVVTTQQDTPGKVTNFEVMRPANIFTTMQVSWEQPLLREKNGIIREYKISHNISGTTTVETITADSKMFQKLYYITPDRYYQIELYAVNTIDQAGEKLRKIYFASSKINSQLSDTGYSIGTVVGAAVGGVLCSGIVLLFVFWLFRRHRKNKTSKASRSKHARQESKIGDQYEDIGMDSASSYQDFGEKDSPNIYDQIGRVHTVDKHYENMLP